MKFPVRRLDQCLNIDDFRQLAERKLPAPVYHFLAGGAEDEVTLGRNTTAFEDYDLVPNYLVGVDSVDASTEVLGQKLEWPVFCSPTGITRLFHPGGEVAVARAAGRTGTAYSLSAAATASIEEVAAAGSGPKFVQIYFLKDPGLTEEFVSRCRAANYPALMATVDTPVAGNRERDVRTGMMVQPKLTLASLVSFASHFGWSFRMLTGAKIGFPNFAERMAASGDDSQNAAEYMGSQMDSSVNWQTAAKLVELWGGPFALKGILSVEDARRAVDIGVSAIIVSNHGGRQFDGAPAAVDRLAPIVDAVGDRAEVILDGGVRRGSHVLKAIALGAKACMIGRPFIYGLAAGGEAGVDRVLGVLRAEVERAMALSGCRTLGDLTRNRVVSRRPEAI